MTIREVFDYDINDEFHLKIPSYIAAPPNAIRKKVIDKFYSINNDTLFYAFYNFSYYSTVVTYPTMHLEYHFSNDTIINSYTNLDSSIIYYDNYFQYDTIFGIDLCGAVTNGYFYTDTTFEPDNYSAIYGKGLGRTHNYFAVCCPLSEQGLDLVYYRKDTVECGTPDLFTGFNISEIKSINIFPNPTSDLIQINNLYNISSIKIFDINGYIIYKINSNSSSESINFSHFDKGVYIIEIQSGNKLLRDKIIKL